MENLDLGYGFLIFSLAFAVLGALTIAHLILGITWMMEVMMKRASARGLLLYGLFFLPGLVVALYYFWWTGICVFLLSAPFLLAIVLIFYRSKKRTPGKNSQSKHNQTNFK